MCWVGNATLRSPTLSGFFHGTNLYTTTNRISNQPSTHGASLLRNKPHTTRTANRQPQAGSSTTRQRDLPNETDNTVLTRPDWQVLNGKWRRTTIKKVLRKQGAKSGYLVTECIKGLYLNRTRNYGDTRRKEKPVLSNQIPASASFSFLDPYRKAQCVS